MTGDAGVRLANPVTTPLRDLSLDVAKGVGIVLVVIGHAWRGLDRAALIENGALFAVIDQLIYNFHMPLFFLLSGMTFHDWVLRRPLGVALGSRVTRLIWPLLLWTYVFAAMRLAAGESANEQLSGWQSLIFLPLPPRDHFWFLWALFLLQVSFTLVIHAYGGRLPRSFWLAVAVVAVLVSVHVPMIMTEWTAPAVIHAAAFAVGIWLGTDIPELGLAGLAAAALAFVGLQIGSFYVPKSLVTVQLLGIALSLAVLAMCRQVAQGCGTLARGLAYLGAASMGIFLAHTIFSAALRTLLVPLSSDLALHVILGTLAGLLGPLLFLAAIRRVGRPSWIGF